MSELKDRKCLPCEGGVKPLTCDQAKSLLQKINGWQFFEENQEISKNFSFKGFYKTMAFVNAVAWIASQENHHPDMKVGYNYCDIVLKTHAINGLSENDFILAAKIDSLFEL